MADNPAGCLPLRLMDDSGVTGIGSNNVANEPITVEEQSPKRSSKRSPKRKENQSEVWDHFEKLEKVPGQKQKYKFSEFNLKKNPGKRQKTLAFEPVNGGGIGTVPKLTAVSFSVEACRKALAEMIILDELPFRFVEGQDFKRFLYVVQPKWENPPVPNHKGETLGKVVEECLVEWGIDKFLTITIDNAKSNDGIIDFLKKKTKKRDTTILDHEYLHVRCCAHILNLVVREGLKDVDVSIARVRNIVRYVRSSPQREDEIGVEFVDNELEGEVHGGLNDIMNFEKQHERGQGKGRGKHVTHGTPKSDDWNVVEMYVEVLKVYYILTEKFSGSLYVTCNTFFKEIMTIKTAIAKLESSDNPKLKVLASGMNKKYDKYWGKFDKINSLLLYANVLDPHYKFVYVRWSLNKHYEKNVVEKKVIEIKEGMQKLFNWYEKKSVEHGKTQNVGEFSRSEKHSKEYMNFCEEMDDEFERHMEEENNMVSKSELERYWLESKEDSKVHGDKFDVLAWWKVNSPRYPLLSQMVRDILAIPVSTIASESAFSMGGRILDPYRTSLSPKVEEALICAQNWLRSATQISLREALESGNTL
ncbi:hypothetical protein RHSIM_Rhsim07G0172000 [Rhododendron simsii]|uniref:Transposase n=1 Tax=Rhododendron simsii TaxID=118357 RepID=A0A834LK25_RHOSS|nr:hypothetical protein RHSIM_Rhsim07G0172000 [Rhododendron simsii]